MSKLAVLIAVLAAAAAFTAVIFALDASAGARGNDTSPPPAAAAAEPAAADAHAVADGPDKAGMTSFAGAAPKDAADLAKAREPYPAELPPLQEGDRVEVEMVLKDMTIELAPGVKYRSWSFDGHGAPGPVVHVEEGQTVVMTLTNGGAIPHSIDFHAARIAPNVAFRDVAPGESFTFEFVAGDPGVYMYHCGTAPVLAHIANGMYGAIVVSPKENPLPPADKEFVLVSSEWYLTSDGLDEPAQFDKAKAHAMMPDWVTWNGYARQYVDHPLEADPGDTVRFWVVAAGPSLQTDFHVVGTIFDRAWVNQDMTQFQTGVQTVAVPAGGGAVFDVKIDDPGLYPFVSHSFASVDLGQVGLLKVGDPDGETSH